MSAYDHLSTKQLATNLATLCNDIHATPRSAMRRGMANSARSMADEIERRMRVADADAALEDWS